MSNYAKLDFWKASDFELEEEIEYKQSQAWHKAIIKDFDYFEYAGAKTLVLIVEKDTSQKEKRRIRLPTIFRTIKKREKNDDKDVCCGQ